MDEPTHQLFNPGAFASAEAVRCAEAAFAGTKPTLTNSRIKNALSLQAAQRNHRAWVREHIKEIAT